MRRASTPERVLLRLKSANSLPDQPEREGGLRVKPLSAAISHHNTYAEGGRCTSAEYSVCTANPMDGMGTADVGAAGLRKTEKSYLPLLDQITDRVGHLLDRRRDRRGVDRAGQYSRCQTGSGSLPPPPGRRSAHSVSWCAPLLITVRVSLTTYIGRPPT